VFDTAPTRVRAVAQEFIPAGPACPSCGGGTGFERERDILMWFDSSHEAVPPFRSEPTRPADIYLKAAISIAAGSRARRCSARARAVPRQVLTHGF
jgi:hypothetical protein